MSIAEDLQDAVVTAAALAVAPHLLGTRPDATAVARAALDAAAAFREGAQLTEVDAGGGYDADATTGVGRDDHVD